MTLPPRANDDGLELMNMYHVRDVMTDQVVTVGKNDDLKHVMEIMEKHNITKVPVLDDGALVGIVSDNMIAKKLGSVRRRGNQPSGLHASTVMEKDFEIAHPDAPLTDLLPKVGVAGLTMIPVVSKGKLVGVHTKANLLHLVESTAPVSSIMTREVHTVNMADRIVHARRLLIDNEIARLPVVDGGKVVGIISEAEIAKAFAHMLQETPFEHQHARAREIDVGIWMRNPVVTGTPDMTVKEVAERMITEQVGGLPLIDRDGRLAGMVTRTDVARTIKLQNGQS